jgi:hypothetical protein
MSTGASKGYYSLIQYCPDLGRLEAANVGVLLFSPERRFLKAVTTRSNFRIIRFFGSEGHDWTRINAFKKGLEDRIELESSQIKSLEDLQRFIDLRANILQITPPRPMKVIDPEKDLGALVKELIGATVHRTSSKTLRRLLADRFSSAGLEPKVRKDIKVSVPVLQKEVEIPFGFLNGRFNLINPVRFEARNPEQSLITACKYAVEGKSLYENPDPELGALQLVIVGKFRSKDHESPDRVNRVFQEYRVKLFRTSEVQQLVEEIRTTGKNIDGTRS